MKKTLWIAIVGALAASVVAASAQEVLSANAVGYIKRTVKAGGKLETFSLSLNNMNEISNVFGRTSVAQDSPRNSTVYFWDGLQWVGGPKGMSGWGVWSNRVVLPGEGFFIKSPATSTVDIAITITGEVPEDSSFQRGITGSSNITLVANPYPVDFVFGSSPLATGAVRNSTVSFWDITQNEGNGAWVGGPKGMAGWGVWSGRVVQAGEAFAFKEAGSSRIWESAKPYTWP